MEPSECLEDRLTAELTAAKQRVRTIQDEAAEAYEAAKRRYRRFLKVARSVRKLMEQKLTLLSRKVPIEARPTIVHSEHRYNGTVACRAASELAQIKLRFSLSHDNDVQTATLDYDLDVLPVYIRFTPHERLVVLIEAYDEQKVSQWLDDRIVDFARVYFQIPLTEPYQREHMAFDPIAKINFPKSFARMTLKHDGKTYYFISDETCWEFERKNGIGVG